MGAVLLDLLYDWVVERGVLALGARILWALRLGRVPFPEQMERTAANVAAGLTAWGLVALALALA